VEWRREQLKALLRMFTENEAKIVGAVQQGMLCSVVHLSGWLTLECAADSASPCLPTCVCRMYRTVCCTDLGKGSTFEPTLTEFNMVMADIKHALAHLDSWYTINVATF
jgi:hypothetical protein